MIQCQHSTTRLSATCTVTLFSVPHQEESRCGCVSESEMSREQRNEADRRHQPRANWRLKAPTSACILRFAKSVPQPTRQAGRAIPHCSWAQLPPEFSGCSLAPPCRLSVRCVLDCTAIVSPAARTSVQRPPKPAGEIMHRSSRADQSAVHTRMVEWRA